MSTAAKDTCEVGWATIWLTLIRNGTVSRSNYQYCRVHFSPAAAVQTIRTLPRVLRLANWGNQ